MGRAYRHKPNTELLPTTRAQIVALKNAGHTGKAIAAQLRLSPFTVYSTIRRWKQTGSYSARPRSGRPEKLTARDKRRIVKVVKSKEHRFDSTLKLIAHIRNNLGVSVGVGLFKQVIAEQGIHCFVAAKKPLLSARNAKIRLAFAKEHLNDSLASLNTIMFSDESAFAVVSGRSRRVFRTREQKHQPGFTVKHAQAGGGHVMVWGAMSGHGLGPLVRITSTMKADDYIAMLQERMLPAFDKFKDDHPGARFQRRSTGPGRP